VTKLFDEPFIDVTRWAATGLWAAVTGRTGIGQQATTGSANLRYNIPAGSQADTVTLGFAVFLTTATAGQLIEVRSDNNGTIHSRVNRQSDGSLQVTLGTITTIGTTAAGLITAGVWYYVELQIRLHDTLGFFTLRVNGTTVASATNIDTKAAGTKTVYDTVYFVNPLSAGAVFDDGYLMSGSGDAFLGDHAVGGELVARDALRVAIVSVGPVRNYRQSVRVAMRPLQGSGTSALAFSASATGVVHNLDNAYLTFAARATGAVVFVLSGSGATAFAFTGLAIAGPVTQASGAATFSLAATATGGPRPAGTARVSFAASAAAAAQTLHGVGATTIRFRAIAVAGFDTWQPRITAALVDKDSFDVKSFNLERAWGLQWQDNISQSGIGKLNLQNDDPDLALMAFGDLVRFALDGRPVFTWRVESMTKDVVATGEEADQFTAVSGRGALARLQRAVVYNERNDPSWMPYADDRTFSFASIYYNDVGWGTPQSFGPQGFTPPDHWINPDGTLAPVNWPDPDAERIWGTPGTIESAPVGTCYFRGRAYFDHTIETMLVATADNLFKLWIDGVPILAEESDPMSWQKCFNAHVTLLGSPAVEEHIWAVRANNSAPTGAANPAHVLLTQVIHEAGTDIFGDVVFRSTADAYHWNVLSYPATPPGWTVGGIVIKLFQEAAARGHNLGLALSFTDTHDSDGAAWDVVPEFTVKIGSTYLDVITALSKSLCDIGVSGDGMTMHAWRYSSRGGATSVTLTPGVNLTELRFEGKV
jgi:hypothetical protein